jgi:hypothetical protein
MKEVFAGIHADFIEVFAAIAMAFPSFTIYHVGFKPFQLYFGIEFRSRCAPKLVHRAKLRKSNGLTFPGARSIAWPTLARQFISYWLTNRKYRKDLIIFV